MTREDKHTSSALSRNTSGMPRYPCPLRARMQQADSSTRLQNPRLEGRARAAPRAGGPTRLADPPAALNHVPTQLAAVDEAELAVGEERAAGARGRKQASRAFLRGPG